MCRCDNRGLSDCARQFINEAPDGFRPLCWNFAMPVALVIVLLDISLIYHASKTGRLQPWAFIILAVPFIGAFAYIIVELIPEWLSGPDARQARKRIAGKLDPEKFYRELSDRLAGADTVANRAAPAPEGQKNARFNEDET